MTDYRVVYHRFNPTSNGEMDGLLDQILKHVKEESDWIGCTVLILESF